MQRWKNKNIEEYWLVFILAVLPKIILALQAFPLKTFSDEVATIASAASLAGYDWSAVVSHAGYYGAGFFWIFAPVFRVTDNPVIIYRVILIGCSLVQACIAPICYYLMNQYFHISDKRYGFIGSIACSYLVMTRATLLFNEHILVLLIWVIALLLLKIHEYQKNTGKKGYIQQYYV